MNDKNSFCTIDDPIRQQLETGWAAGNPQPIEAHVGEPTCENDRATLEEMMHIELDFRGIRTLPGETP